MRATIEKSLCIGITKTRFDLFDYVKLQMVSGKVIEGEIIDFVSNNVVQISTSEGIRDIRVSDIENYIY